MPGMRGYGPCDARHRRRLSGRGIDAARYRAAASALRMVRTVEQGMAPVVVALPGAIRVVRNADERDRAYLRFHHI